MSHPSESQPSNNRSPLELFVPVLAYHKIDGGFELGVNSVLPKVFDRQMRFLAENGYTAITVDRFIQAIDTFSRRKNNSKGCSSSSQLSRDSTSRLNDEENNRNAFPRSHEESVCKKQEEFNLPPRSIMITFDDGYEDFYTLAQPILAQYGLTATVFVLAGYIGKLNTWDVRLRLKRSRHLTNHQIQSLFGCGFGIASHGMHHRFLTCCSKANTKAELWESKTILERLLCHPVHSFAYPYGCTNPRVSEQVKSAGYRIAFGLKPSRSIEPSSIYSYPRIAVYRCDTLSTFKAKLGLRGQYHFKIECMKNSVINRLAYLNRLRH